MLTCLVVGMARCTFVVWCAGKGSGWQRRSVHINLFTTRC